MPPENTRPIQPGRFPPLKPNVPTFHTRRGIERLDRESWSVFDLIYPHNVATDAAEDLTTEFISLPEFMDKGNTFAAASVIFKGWGQVSICGMVDSQGRCPSLGQSVSIDYELARALTGLQLTAPIDWEWLPAPKRAEYLWRRCWVMLLGLSVCWWRDDDREPGPANSLIRAWCSQWKCVENVPVIQTDMHLDLRDPSTFRA